MSRTTDPAILRALSLDPSSTRVTSHGGSGFTSTFRLTASPSSSSSSSSSASPAKSKSFFVKTSTGPKAAVMFQGEHVSLNAIHAVVPSLCPRSFAWGQMEQRRDDDDDDDDAYFLATEFINLSGGGRRRRRTGRSSSLTSGAEARVCSSSGMSLAQKLARLHTTPAPIPDGYEEPQFGFPVTTCCGDTPQPNTFTSSWADFFARNRLLFILERGESRNGRDPGLRKLVEKVASVVVPRLLGAGHLGCGTGSNGVSPVIVHGDLWSGNHGTGTFLGRSESDQSGVEGEKEEEEEEVIYDPSACYAHSEYELGIMNMFGGFGAAFMKEYHELVPKTEPVDEYDDRLRLYEVYHHLNHWAIFSGGYRAGAVSILNTLADKYGEDG